MNKKIITLTLGLVFTTTIFLTGCSKDDDNPTEPTSPIEIAQPNPIAPDNTFSGTVGFWDFNASGNNSVTGESGNWIIDGISYGEKGLVFDDTVSKEEANNSRVQLFNPSGSSEQGLFQQRYFSGAVKFKVEKDPDEAFSYPILSFGYDNRFLDLEIFNGEIRMMTNNSNIAEQTNIEIPEKVWNVLYFRYEGFLAPNDNKFYLQLNDGEEVTIDLMDFEIDEFTTNDDINLGFSSRDIVFKGIIDWVMLGRGRMTPGNAQYLVEDFKN